MATHAEPDLNHAMQVAVFDSKPYDVDALKEASAGTDIAWRFLDFRLEPETAEAARGAQAICIFVNDRADAASLKILAELGVKLITLRCAGFNGVDLPAARALGLHVTRVPAYSPHAVAEHTVALLLALVRKIPRAAMRVRDLNFSLSGLVGFDLHAKTAGIIGTGRTGRLTAQILRGFGMQVLAVDQYPDADWAKSHGVEYTDFPTLVSRSDIISLHAPLTPETRYLIRRDTIEKMRPGVVLVNVSRGALVETSALIAGLKSGHLGGVALDVYEEEEGIFFEDLSGQILHDDELARLLTFPNVLVTAHQAFLTREALAEIGRVTVANLRALHAGQSWEPESLVT